MTTATTSFHADKRGARVKAIKALFTAVTGRTTSSAAKALHYLTENNLDTAVDTLVNAWAQRVDDTQRRKGITYIHPDFASSETFGLVEYDTDLYPTPYDARTVACAALTGKTSQLKKALADLGYA